jgi:hypothetical protein
MRPLETQEAGNPQARSPQKFDLPQDQSTKTNDNWLAEYPEEIREAVRMDKRRRAASLGLPPLPSGQRDPWDLIRRDGPQAA